MEGIDTATVIRELQAEVEFWKARSLALSSAVTSLSQRIADFQPEALDLRSAGEIAPACNLD